MNARTARVTLRGHGPSPGARRSEVRTADGHRFMRDAGLP